MVTVKMMQQVWAVIESTRVSSLLQVDDTALVQLLIKQFAAQQQIDAQATSNLSTYIHSKLPLIRDIAAGKLALMRDQP